MVAVQTVAGGGHQHRAAVPMTVRAEHSHHHLRPAVRLAAETGADKPSLRCLEVGSGATGSLAGPPAVQRLHVTAAGVSGDCQLDGSWLRLIPGRLKDGAGLWEGAGRAAASAISYYEVWGAVLGQCRALLGGAGDSASLLTAAGGAVIRLPGLPGAPQCSEVIPAALTDLAAAPGV